MVSARILRAIRPRPRPHLHAAGSGLDTRSRVGPAFLALVLGVVPMLVWPRTAEASAIACTRTGLGFLCNDTDSRGAYVGDVRAWMNTKTWTCNKEFRVRGTLADGHSYERSAVSRCGWSRVSMQFGVGKTFGSGSYVCVGVREYGRQNPWEPYEACNRIRR